MDQRVDKRALERGLFTVAIVVVGLAGFWLGSTMRSPEIAPVSADGGGVPRASPTGGTLEGKVFEGPKATAGGVLATGPMMTQLAVLQSALQKARTNLPKATVSTHGGYVEKARANIKIVQGDMDAIVGYISEHPTIAEV